MTKLTSVADLPALRKELVAEREAASGRPCLVINAAGGCAQATAARDVLRAMKRFILQHGLQDRIRVRVTACQGLCELNPFILVEPLGTLYVHVGVSDVPRLVQAVLGEHVLADLLYEDKATHRRCRSKDEIPFLQRQRRTVLGSNEKIDPIRIADYIAIGGYTALEKVLAGMDPVQIIEEMKKSELRGRGGAGFPTGLKWEAARNAKSARRTKYLVCNADEGDPGAYMDRSLLEGNPHSVIEGMIIGAVAIGATKGIIYVRDEYPLAVKHAIIALRQARDVGLLSENILGSGVDFNIDIVRGAGAFVCGEETALIRSIEGRLAEPRQRPPYPVEKGIGGNPTCINNVETLANVPIVIGRGADEYVKVGVPRNRGTKIFSLVGKIRNTGLVEVPFGTRLAEVVFDIGGGAPRSALVKAVQTGGPSGGCIPASLFDLPITYESLAEAGSIVGSGGMIIMDADTCMVDVAKYFMAFLKDESCGKCFICRKGTQRMHEILDDISKGTATCEHLALLEELALVVKDASMCGLGQTAANPILSTLRYFRDEYLVHIEERRCPAGVCKELTGAPCQAACPLGTEAWRYVAHVARGEYEQAYRVLQESNPFPSVCARVCHHSCEARCRLGATGGEPVAIRALKRFLVDRVDPSVFRPERRPQPGADQKKIAIVGAGPAGLTAAHELSLLGYRSTVFEAGPKPGGMLVHAIPSYRLPREILEREIAALIDENITLRCGTTVGRDVTLDELSEQYDAVFLAAGAHDSGKLGVPGEDASGVLPALDFLAAFNLRGEALAAGRVGVVGGGNSAVDAARVALRQENVRSVTIFYRRTQAEMPAIAGEVAQAIAEGVRIETLVSPRGVRAADGRLSGLTLVRNRQGDYGPDGRRKPEPVDGSEFSVDLDTLLVAIGERPQVGWLPPAVGVAAHGAVRIDPRTLATDRPGIFAGGDFATGPDTVVAAIAAGKKAAVMIDRHLRGAELFQRPEPQLPVVRVEPWGEPLASEAPRLKIPTLAIRHRRHNLREVERTVSEKQAVCEARRCLRCDLEFTGCQSAPTEREVPAARHG